MKIIWLSEIKWSYLRTRKQHILSNFDNTDEILFVEPLSFNLKNKFHISIEKNIKYVTIPQVQNSDIVFINYLINFFPFKWLLKKISKFLINNILRKIDFKPDILITSNVFWIDYLIEIKNRLGLKVIYDCNDNPLAFPNSSNKETYFIKTLKYADKIIVPFKSYINFIPKQYHSKIEIISNGVDSKLILSDNKEQKTANSYVEKLKDKDIVMFIGSIDTRLDFDLIEKVVCDLSKMHFLFIGDIKRQVEKSFKQITKFKNVYHINSINYNQIGQYLNYAKVCIIPFKRNNLSKFILPNKIFEYSILEKPFILTNFNFELKDLNPDFLIAKDHFEFSKLILEQIDNPMNTQRLKAFASKYEWNQISSQYRAMILDNLKK